MRIGVVIPTVAGRETELRRSLHSIENAIRPVGVSVDVEVVEGLETCGEAWNVGAARLLERFPDDLNFFLFTADDLIADERWLGAALDRVRLGDRRGELPAPQLFLPDGRRDPRTDDGPDGVGVLFSRVPFVPWALWNEIAPIPHLHYYSDVWIGDRAGEHGYVFRVTAGFRFVHLWSKPGRYSDDRYEVDRDLYERSSAQ